MRMLTQVRKYKGAITFSHQYLDQIPASIRAGVISNTAIKLAGGISQKDAAVLAPEFRTNTDFLLSVKKKATETEFALFAKNATDTPLKLHVPLGYLENSEPLSDDEYEAMLAHSRAICATDQDDDVEANELIEDSADEDVENDIVVVDSEPDIEPTTEPVIRPVSEDTVPNPKRNITKTTEDELADLPTLPSSLGVPVTPATPTTSLNELRPVEVVATPILRKEGGGGVKHQHIQNLVKELGEQSGWRVTLEETVLEGTGRIDVVARRDDARMLVEVSMTTTREHEYANIKKCLEFGGTYILMVATPARHLTSLRKYIEPLLNASEKELVRFMLPDELPAFFDALTMREPVKHSIVKGYKVRSKVLASSPDEAIARRKAVAMVLANSELK